MKRIQELQCQLTPTVMSTTTNKNNNLIAMEIDAMLEGEGEGDEE